MLHPGSFRDPDGFVFLDEGISLRQINPAYRLHYDQLMSSGLYQTLVSENLLIPHEELDLSRAHSKDAYKIIKPGQISFISYPHEWSFSQIRDAALLTLGVQKRALAYGMSLKDANAANVQFQNGAPVFIDTLSFEKYEEGDPWIAYRQFCQHFLAPLALMSYKDSRLAGLLRVHLDGIPLDLASNLLPLKSRLNLGLLLHIHFHAGMQRRYQNSTLSIPARKKMRPASLLGLIDHLETVVRNLKWLPQKTAWSGYDQDCHYGPSSLLEKERAVSRYLLQINSKLVWDIGANTGRFSRIAARQGALVISMDADPAAVEKNYLQCKTESERRILPLCLDITNPSAGLGWDGRERLSLWERPLPDTVLALALVHHLAIGENIPLDKVAETFAKICSYLIIEFIPKTDPKVRQLLVSRPDIFSGYDQASFERTFQSLFSILKHTPVTDSGRILYLMKKN